MSVIIIQGISGGTLGGQTQPSQSRLRGVIVIGMCGVHGAKYSEMSRSHLHGCLKRMCLGVVSLGVKRPYFRTSPYNPIRCTMHHSDVYSITYRNPYLLRSVADGTIGMVAIQCEAKSGRTPRHRPDG